MINWTPTLPLTRVSVSHSHLLDTYMRKTPKVIHWDRDGATSYQALWLYQGAAFSVWLILVFKRPNHLQKGYDTSVLCATPANIQAISFEQPLREKNPAQREFRILTVLDYDHPTVEKRFMISFPPRYTTRSPFGQATGPMVAFHMGTGEVVV